MSERGRAPFGRRKQKKTEFEPVPVVTGENVEADPPSPPVVTSPTEGRVTPDEDSRDIVHEFQRLPVHTIRADERQEASPIAGIPRAFTREHTEEQVVIQGYNVEAAPVEPYKPSEPTTQELVNEVTGRASLLAAAGAPPQKKGEKKIIRG